MNSTDYKFNIGFIVGIAVVGLSVIASVLATLLVTSSKYIDTNHSNHDAFDELDAQEESIYAKLDRELD